MSEPKCNDYAVRIQSNGPVFKTVTVEGDKAYFNIQKAKSEKCNVSDITVGSNYIRFNLTTRYSIKINLYPTGCPVAYLPINEEFSKESEFLMVDVTKTRESITIEGLIPAEMELRFTTDVTSLKYFNTIEIVGDIVVGNNGCVTKSVIKRDSETKVRWISNRPSSIAVLPPLPIPNPGENILLPGQYPNNTSYPWESAIIPWKQNQPFPRGPGVIITKPNQPKGKNNKSAYNLAFNKFRSIPDIITYYLGYDPATTVAEGAERSLFTRNYDVRGYARTEKDEPDWSAGNLAKKQYMSAINVDKIQYYEDKIRRFANTSYTEVVTSRLPFTSSFRNNVTLFFLDIHVGFYEYPDWVLEYFNGFTEAVGIGDPNNPRFFDLITRGNYLASRVFDYFQEKVSIAIQNHDKSCIAYWFSKAGMSPRALLSESVHNIVAFSQFSNTLYSILYSSIVPQNILNPNLPEYPNFFKLYREATTADERLDVIREAFRLTVPNSISFSSTNDNPNMQGRHMHQEIMIQNSPGKNLNEKLANYFTYKPNMYKDFQSNVEDFEGIEVENDYLSVMKSSPLDRETVVDNRRDIIPIFSKPLYTTFGLGYRRCPGEILVYRVTAELLEKFSDAEFEIRTDGNHDTVYVAPFKGVPDNIYAVQPKY